MMGIVQPEYIHVLLNPFPVYGMAAGLFFLIVSLWRKKESTPALAWLILMSLATGATIYYGERGYDRLFPALDPEAQRWLDLHMERAEDFILIFYTVGAAALASWLAKRKWPRLALALEWLTVALALTSVCFGAWIGRAGGQIRHSEFRQGSPAPPPAHAHHHH